MALRDIRGHQSIRRLIAQAAMRDTLPPCLVFSGPAGVGKRRLALALAAVLNCDVGPDATAPDACGTCRACLRIARGVHTDVIIIEPGDTGSIKVDVIRSLIDRAMFRPFEGRRRVVIVDDADLLVPQAQNALLKTLEEPPDASVFLLVTSRPHLLLPTVRSRCPELRFGGLPAAEIVDLLMLEHAYKRGEAQAAAGSADGSVSRALEAGSGEHLQARESVTAVLRALAPAPNSKRRLEVGKNLAEARRGGRSSASADRETLTRRLRVLGALLRDLQVVSSRGESAWLSNADIERELKELARSYDAERARCGFVSVDRAVHALTRNASPKVVADWLALRL